MSWVILKVIFKDGFHIDLLFFFFLLNLILVQALKATEKNKDVFVHWLTVLPQT